jgi:hypothetical protein
MSNQSYRDRASRYDAAARDEQKRIRVLSNARFALFIIAVIALWLLRGTVWFGAVAVVAGTLFVMLVQRHRAARDRLQDLQTMSGFCAVGLARAKREWSAIPIVLRENVEPDHPYAADLELFGSPALSQLFGPAHTLHGQRILRRWLLTRVSPEEVRARQDAVQQLARDPEYRDRLAAATHRTLAGAHARVDQFIDWIQTSRMPPVSPALVWLARLIPATTLTLAALQVAGVLSRNWWLLPLAAGGIFSGLTLRRIYRTFDAAFARDPAPLRYSRSFAVAAEAPGEAALLTQIRTGLHAKNKSASERIRRLEQIMLYADVRHSGTASMVLELFVLWSFHIAQALRAWQEDAREDLAGWFEALGTLEALSALATLADDHPDWCFPQIDNAAQQIEATQLGHPLLRDDARVDNDVVLGPPGTMLLVTGSNMSGKSTLLRAIGVNTVLAQAGAPVCARAYRAPTLRLYTSVNVRDSLAAGVSLYLAQLRRIKTVLDAAQAQAPELCCYLLDEILSGTNSTDRTTAVRAIMHQLLQLSAIGALATHDLALAADEKIRASAHTIHFREAIDPESGGMTFDYKIREGALQSTNALALLALMGIDIELHG